MIAPCGIGGTLGDPVGTDVRPLPARRAFEGGSVVAATAQAVHVVLVVLALFGTAYGRDVVSFGLTGPFFLVLAAVGVLALWNIWRGWLRGYIESLVTLATNVAIWIVVRSHGFYRNIPVSVRVLLVPEAFVVAAVVGGELIVRLKGGRMCRNNPYKFIFRDQTEIG